MSAQPTWSPVDDDTADLLDLIQADWRPFAEDDRNVIAHAIRDVAGANDGKVHPNDVRAALAALPVLEQPKPQRVGPVYRALVLFGDLRVDGWDESNDLQGRNSGKPCRIYRWAGPAS